MLNQFRSLAGNLAAKILLALLVLSFAIWGVGDMVRHSGKNLVLAKVGSSDVKLQEFNVELRRAAEGMRRALGDHFTPEMIRMTNLHVQVLQKLINQKLLTMESENLGLLPSDSDVVRHIRNTPMFQDKKGNFDKDHFDAMLRSSNMSEKVYVNHLRKDMATSLLVDTLLSNIPVPNIAAQTLLAAREEQRFCTLYTLSPALVSNVPQPDANTISDYYNAHSASFTAPEYRNLTYVVISSNDINKGTRVTEEELRKAYDERKSEFRHPERRTVDQLLYSSEDKAQNAVGLLRKGTPFDQVTRETEILNPGATSLGKVGRSAIIENAADIVFNLRSGEFSDPIQSPFGWHVFRVSAIDPASITPFEDVRASLEHELKQRNSDSAQSKLANKLEDALAAGSTLQEAAKELGLKTSSIGPINKQGIRLDGTAAVDLPELDKFLDTAFRTDEKSQSSLIASKGGKYYIVQVDSVIPERLRALDEVRGLVVSNWQTEERAKRLGELAKDIGSKFTNEASRDAVIEKYDLMPEGNVTIKRSTRTAGHITLPTALVDDAFLQAAGGSTQPYPVEKGKYVIAVVNRIIPMPSIKTSAKLQNMLRDIRDDLEHNVQNEILAEYTRYLSDKYGVSIDESALESVME